MRRFFLLLVVGLGLAPGTFWRSELPPPNDEQILTARPLPLPKGDRARIGGEKGPLVTGIWELSSPNDAFGSYSALLAPAEGTLLALSDTGHYLRMAAPPALSGRAEIGSVLPGSRQFKQSRDVEAAAQGVAAGRIWMALEGLNAVLRSDGRFGNLRRAAPEAMREWPSNSGPEAMTRLPDGKFIVLSEELGADGGLASQGLLFPGDPVEGAKPVLFSLVPPEGYRPSGAATLPDGRVLILLRGVKIGLPPRFTAQLLVADPREIEESKPWEWEALAQLEDPVPHDNYEGITVTGGKNGDAVVIWLISDDNGAKLVQRSLLVRLEWQGGSATR